MQEDHIQGEEESFPSPIPSLGCPSLVLVLDAIAPRLRHVLLRLAQDMRDGLDILCLLRRHDVGELCHELQGLRVERAELRHRRRRRRGQATALPGAVVRCPRSGRGLCPSHSGWRL
jgi:hypothetical protein